MTQAGGVSPSASVDGRYSEIDYAAPCDLLAREATYLVRGSTQRTTLRAAASATERDFTANYLRRQKRIPDEHIRLGGAE